jgi:hypothetical protein
MKTVYDLRLGDAFIVSMLSDEQVAERICKGELKERVLKTKRVITYGPNARHNKFACEKR